MGLTNRKRFDMMQKKDMEEGVKTWIISRWEIWL